MNLKNNSIIKNAGWIMAGKIIHMLLSFVIGLITARYLGPGNYGLINYAAAYATFFTAICTLGINSIIVKNFVDHPDEEGVALGTTILLRVISGFLSIGVITVIVSIVDAKETLTIVVVVLYSISLLFQSFDIFHQWFQSKLLSKYYAISTLISYCAASVYKIFLLATGKDIRWFAVSNSVDYLIVAVVLLLFYKKCKGPAMSFSWKKAKELLSSSHSYIIVSLMSAIYASTDKLMLKQLMEESAVGYYALAVSVSSMWVFVLSAIIESLSPSIMKYHNTDKAQYIIYNKRLYAIVFYCSVIASLGICLIAPLFIKIVYGEAYINSVAPLRIVVWYTAFSYLGTARNVWIVCERKQKYLKYIYITSAFTNVVFNYVFIPMWGASGAAFASLITQILTIAVAVFIKPLRPNAKLMLDAIMLKGVLPERKK